MSDTSLTLRGCAGVTGRVASFPPVMSTITAAPTRGGPGGERAHDVTAALVGLPRRLEIPERTLRRDRCRQLERPRQVAGQQHGEQRRQPERDGERHPCRQGCQEQDREQLGVRGRAGGFPAARAPHGPRQVHGQEGGPQQVQAGDRRQAGRASGREAGRLCSRLAQGPIRAPQPHGPVQAQRGDPQKRRRERAACERRGPPPAAGLQGPSWAAQFKWPDSKIRSMLVAAPEKAWGDGKDVVAPRKRRLWIGGFSA